MALIPERCRLSVYKQFKEGQKRVLVATDLIGRGIDIERVNIVINYDMPETDDRKGNGADTYLHRVRLPAALHAGRAMQHSVGYSAESRQHALQNARPPTVLSLQPVVTSVGAGGPCRSFWHQGVGHHLCGIRG